jgi:hypothetical protein
MPTNRNAAKRALGGVSGIDQVSKQIGSENSHPPSEKQLPRRA